MQQEKIFLYDWKRILFGTTPPEFILEVFGRTLIIYLILLVAIRIFGKRLSGQLTITEMSIMLTMGAILAPAMQLADRGLLAGVVALLCALAFQRGINYWGLKNSKAEALIQGKEVALIEDGIMNLKNLRSSRVSRPQLLSALRSENIYTTGSIYRVYLEACGTFSIYTHQTNKSGLSTLMDSDAEIHSIQELDPHSVACQRCGNTVQSHPKPGNCPICDANQWSRLTANQIVCNRIRTFISPTGFGYCWGAHQPIFCWKLSSGRSSCIWFCWYRCDSWASGWPVS
ncbi:DUF421 domain-containing protein [Spirosoma rhododendri]|uniref:DUF421 domain-containing protein n=1 Tax=Spirosoma rhododendri TaxID=2728024 RepID=A0A7L5DQK2_9BACT|nr:YetF domain-containing protein [Spirosoma rhododendri]QJD79503.1 DUF421 domain-containing protein [Spirosoma rhododendri]